MKLLITGSSGFLGRYVVAEALRRGHSVRAMVRNEVDRGAGSLEHVRADLRSRRGLVEAVRGVDAVLHLAAAKSGDMYAQYAGTVVATENLLWAMDEANVQRIVGVSSFAVYHYMKLFCFGTLDESSPLESDAFERDEYAHTKLVQERLIREHAATRGWHCTILRPGVIYGPGNLWTFRLGVQASPKLWVRMGAWARVPLTYVENCAEAIVMAAETGAARGQVLNVVDDEMPTQRAYVSMLRKRSSPRPSVVPISWTVMRSLARSAWLFNRLVLHGRAKLPSLLIPERLHARCKPLRFSNKRIKEILGWQPRYSLAEGLERSLTNVAPMNGNEERSPRLSEPVKGVA